jgi:hypothetical protein
MKMSVETDKHLSPCSLCVQVAGILPNMDPMTRVQMGWMELTRQEKAERKVMPLSTGHAYPDFLSTEWKPRRSCWSG